MGNFECSFDKKCPSFVNLFPVHTMISAPNKNYNVARYKPVTTAPSTPLLDHLIDGMNFSPESCPNRSDTVQWELDLLDTYLIHLVRLVKGDCGKHNVSLRTLINIEFHFMSL